MAKDHGPSVKDDKQYEGLRKKGMSKERAAKIANTPDASSKGGKAAGSGKKRDTKSQGGSKAQKAAAGRKGGKASAGKSS
jgi:hypothetical protein